VSAVASQTSSPSSGKKRIRAKILAVRKAIQKPIFLRTSVHIVIGALFGVLLAAAHSYLRGALRLIMTSPGETFFTQMI
jgi:hypothetical protein